ncbi:MAG TPA: hypothetical protein PK358_10735 [Spirochaetota bacterium]|nr:hypothetical protein [Spirochaetota bacterium]
MKNSEFLAIPSKVRNLFIAALFYHPIFFILLTFPISDSGPALFFKAFITVYPAALIVIFLVFSYLYRQFKADINFVYESGDGDAVPQETVERIDRFPVMGMALVFAGFMVSVLVIVILFTLSGVFNSRGEAVFAGLLGSVTFLIASMVFYVRSRKAMFILEECINIRVLTMFEKLAAPVILTILSLLCIVNVAKFVYVDKITIDLRQREIAESVEKTSLGIDSYINELFTELHVYSNDSVMKEMNYGRVDLLLRNMQKTKRNENIQLFLHAIPRGEDSPVWENQVISANFRSFSSV